MGIPDTAGLQLSSPIIIIGPMGIVIYHHLGVSSKTTTRLTYLIKWECDESLLLPYTIVRISTNSGQPMRKALTNRISDPGRIRLFVPTDATG